MLNRACALLAVSFLLATFTRAADTPVRTCASLKQLALSNVTITLAEPVAAGMFMPPGPKPDEKAHPVYKAAPAFCRVAATLTPTADSDIKVEIWMPASGWNGKFRGEGNGGFAGSINYLGLAGSVAKGYTSASTDTGHSNEGAQWAIGHPEKVIDYGFRAVHLMTITAKRVVQSFYGDAPKKSYFSGCSNGGRQALMEAQRFPDDYDGILAGDPANAWAPLITGQLNFVLAVDGAGYIPSPKIATIAKAVLAACDELDGVKDGVLNDPRQCHFDASVLLCKEQDSNECLTAPQVAALKQIYAGTRDSSGKLILPGMLPGAEDGAGAWKEWITGSEPGKSIDRFFVQGNFADLVYGQRDWDFHHADIDASLKAAYEKSGDAMDAMNPDLKPFVARGGKLILYHGWNDPAIPALSTVNYFDSVLSAMGKESVEKSMRLYMVPGMQHCTGGPGATSFGQFDFGPRDGEHNVFTALVEWVEKGRAPGTIIAAKLDEGWKTVMTRPLCHYPEVAKYKGSGDSSVESSFECVARRSENFMP